MDPRKFLELSMLAAPLKRMKSEAKSGGASGVAKAGTTTDAEVLVVGAGMAGLSAACALQQAGLSVIVIEARDRIGGRMWTDRSVPGLTADLGAQWLTHMEVSPLVDMAASSGIELDKCDLFSQTYYDLNRARMDACEQQAMSLAFSDFTAKAFGVHEAVIARGLPDVSVKDAMDVVRATSTPPLPDLVITNLIRQLYETGINDSYERFSFDNITELVEAQTFSDALIPNGYDQFVKLLARGLDVRLKHVVEAVQYTDHGVSVVTNKGTFSGRKAVITLPHAVLKSGMVAFEPGLPEEKQDAINRLATGLTDKFFFKFPRVFWDTEPDFIVRFSDDLRWQDWLNVAKYFKAPILVAFNTGPHARMLEEATDSEVVSAGMDALSTIYGSGLPEPEGMVRSKWGQETFSRGAISYLPPNVTTVERATLQRPVNGVLFFAGEATSINFATLVLGAYETGQLAASQILAQQQGHSG